MSDRYTRRRVLQVAGLAAAVGVAGCSSDDSPQADDTDEETFLAVDGDVTREAVAYHHAESIGDYEEVPEIDGYLLPVDFTEEGTESFAETFEELEVPASPAEFELLTYVDGESVHDSPIDFEFAQSVVQGGWEGQLAVSVDTEANAQRLQELIGDA